MKSTLIIAMLSLNLKATMTKKVTYLSIYILIIPSISFWFYTCEIYIDSDSQHKTKFGSFSLLASEKKIVKASDKVMVLSDK